MKTLVHKNCNFELYSVLKRQPVEFFQCRCNMSRSIKTKYEYLYFIMFMLHINLHIAKMGHYALMK